MSFFIPLPRHSTKPYREYLNALRQEFLCDSPYAQARITFAAHAWTRWVDASTAYAELADKPSTSEHHLTRVRANRRLMMLAARAYQLEHKRITSELPRRNPQVLPDTGASLVARRRNGAGGGRVRTQEVHTRMEREARGGAAPAREATG